MSATPTPRTDAAEAGYRTWNHAIRTFPSGTQKKEDAIANPAPDGWDHARELERELAEANESEEDARDELKAIHDWNEAQPESVMVDEFYAQATRKLHNRHGKFEIAEVIADGLRQLAQLRADVRPLVALLGDMDYDEVGGEWLPGENVGAALTAFLAAHPEFNETES